MSILLENSQKTVFPCCREREREYNKPNDSISLRSIYSIDGSVDFLRLYSSRI